MKTGANYAHAEQVQCAVPACARAAGGAGRVCWLCALTLQEKCPKTHWKQKTGSEGERTDGQTDGRTEGNLLK